MYSCLSKNPLISGKQKLAGPAHRVCSVVVSRENVSMATPTTPEKRPHAPRITTTSHAPRTLVSATQQSQDLAGFRDAVRRDTCEADVIPSDILIEGVCGPLEDLSEIRKSLEAEQSLSNRGWKALYTSGKDSYRPVDSPLEEDQAFAGLATIFEQCLRAAGIIVADSIVQFSVHGHANMASSYPNKTRPDATIHLTNSSFRWIRVQLDHGDVCLYVEFKKKKTPTNFDDDASKLLWNVHHRFRCDPCCRFVCGLTIENTTARFWHFSRAAVMVSEPFDIIKDADRLIHIFVASARAKSPADLGFDPTIKCITENSADQRQYQITIDNNKDAPQESIDRGQLSMHTFTTERVISNYRAVGIRSRSSWVFEGREGVATGGAPVVIKDVWIDSDREAEGTILENVREALKDTPDDLQYFLEPLCHGCALIDGIKDLTQAPLWRTKIMSFFYSGEASSTPSTSASGPSGASEELSVGSPPTLRSAEPVIIGRRGDRRKHYRVVFKGKPGCALQELETYEDLFKCLLGGVKALRALHAAGYIHRDLSSGNLLLLGAKGKERGVLIDLEYAKKFPDTSEHGHDTRTGTLQFMAVEIHAREFLFLPEPVPELLNTGVYDTDPIFFHNPIHDMESAWWIALWIFHHLKDKVDADLFKDNSLRMRMLTSSLRFRVRCHELPAPVLKLMEKWLNFLRSKYAELEKQVRKSSPVPFNYDAVFHDVIKFVEAIIEVLPKRTDSNLGSEGLTSSPEVFT